MRYLPESNIDLLKDWSEVNWWHGTTFILFIYKTTLCHAVTSDVVDKYIGRYSKQTLTAALWNNVYSQATDTGILLLLLKKSIVISCSSILKTHLHYHYLFIRREKKITMYELTFIQIQFCFCFMFNFKNWHTCISLYIWWNPALVEQ